MAHRNFFIVVLVSMASVVILGQGNSGEAPKLPMARPEEVGMSLGRKTVELMTANHTGDLFRVAPGMSFGLGYAIVEDVGASGLPGTRGMYTWPGSLTTTSFVDPTEEMVGVMLIQLQPRSANITNEFQVLSYQAITDSARVRQ